MTRYRSRTFGNDRVRLTVDLFAVHRPRLHWLWQEETDLLVWLDWSDGSSDPVWSLDVLLRFPRRLADFLAALGVG